MTAILIYYFIFISFTILFGLLVYKFFDMFIDLISGLIEQILK